MAGRLIFLGTAGGRVVVYKQLRASGGIWFEYNDTRMLIDPGPCSLRCITKSKHKLDPTKLDAIYVSHRHLDHSIGANAVIEAMTEGGFKPRGTLFITRDALEDDPVILKYLQKYLKHIVLLEESKTFKLKDIEFTTPVKHIHGVETYGFNLRMGKLTISYIADTKYFPELPDYYNGDIMIINVVRYQPSNLLHLCIPEVKQILTRATPKKAIITHFGMTMLRARPWEVAARLTEETGVDVVAANDGMMVEL